MKRFIAILIALTMLMGHTAGVASTGPLYFGDYIYDPSGSLEYEEPEGGYTMIDYGDYVVTIEYFELEAEGFDQAYFDKLDENDGVADSWEIASLLLSIKYSTDNEENIYAWYEEEPIDTGFAVDGILFNGELIEDLYSGKMAGMAFYTDGTLLLFEVISFANHEIHEMQQLRSQHLASLTYNGVSVVSAAGSNTDTLSAINALMSNTNTSSDTVDDEQADTEVSESIGSLVSGIGSSLDIETSSTNETVPTDISGVIGSNIAAGIPSADNDSEDIQTIGRYAYDTVGCELFEASADELYVDYGARVVYIEYGTYAQYGKSFTELCDIAGINYDCRELAWMLYESSDYADEEAGIYVNTIAFPITDYVESGTYPDGVIFIGNLSSEYGSGPVVGCILVSEDDILMLDCDSFGYNDTEAEMIEFFLEVMGSMTYDSMPVLK